MKRQSLVGQPKEQQECVIPWKYRKESTMVSDKPWWVIYGENGFIAPVMFEQDAINLCAAHNASLGDEQKAVSETEVQRFLREYDEGKHTLPQQYVEALARSRKQLFKMVRDILASEKGEKGSLNTLPPTPTNTSGIQAKFSDSDRKRFLEDNGYVSDTDFVDWALERHYCPAYWRPWKPGDPDTTNGMILVKRGDRERIDQCIADRLSPSCEQRPSKSEFYEN